MEITAFIHGSSVGQSVLIPSGAPVEICNDIATKYFQGRVPRQKESAAGKSLFVDLYKSSKGIYYTLYSYVINSCFGANGRDGQYFAISVLSKGGYVYPETVYYMFQAAYNTLFKTYKILKINEQGENQYVISQFAEQKDYLTALLKKIESSFEGIISRDGLTITESAVSADYDSWKGYKVTLDVCNSMFVYRSLLETGRIYISEEYESLSATIKNLRSQIQKLETDNAKIERKYAETVHSENSKVQNKINELNALIDQKDIEIRDLQSKNNDYQATIDIISEELGKHAKESKPITALLDKKQQVQGKSRKDVLKLCLLMAIFLLTLLSSIANYSFFRNFPQYHKDEAGRSVTADKNAPIVNGDAAGTVSTGEVNFAIGAMSYAVGAVSNSDGSIVFDNSGGFAVVDINADAVQVVCPDWISASIVNKQLLILVQPNVLTVYREAELSIYGSKIHILQHEKTDPDFGLVVKYKNGNVLVSEYSKVAKGDTLYATVNYWFEANNFGWKYNENLRPINDQMTQYVVTGDVGSTAIISYGRKTDAEGNSLGYLQNRQRVLLSIQ